MIYGIKDKPCLKDLLVYGFQQMLSILTATILISTICGTSISAGLVGAGLATIAFLYATNFSAPLFFSNSGSTCAAVITAIALTGDYTGVAIGGITVFLMNIIASILVQKVGSNWINKLLPPIVSGTIVLIIGLNLASFCPTYALVNGEYNIIGVIIALVVMIVTVLTMHYGKGKISTLPFLVGAGAGYILCLILTLCGIPLINFDVFTNMKLFSIPDFAFLNIDFSGLELGTIITIIVTFFSVNLANLGEHISDVLAVSAILDEDLTKTVGLDKTLAGDGLADLVGTMIGGCPTTTYSESLSTIVVSKVASTRVIFTAALMTILLGFFGPFNALIVSMPNCIFAGLSLVAYGCIAFAGVRTLHDVELTNRNMLIFAVMATIGISGLAISFGTFTLEKIAFSMIAGLILNLILHD